MSGRVKGRSEETSENSLFGDPAASWTCLTAITAVTLDIQYRA